MITFYKLFVVLHFYTIHFALSKVDSISKEKIIMRTDRLSSVVCIIE